MSDTLTRGLLVIDTLRIVQPVLEKWQALNQDDFWFEEGDAPWWYNERATLSLFAGAIWQSGGRVFEAFSSRKAIGAPGRKVNSKSGRGELQFWVGERGFVAEVKQCWPILGRDMQTARKVVESALSQAKNEVLRLPALDGESLGITFAVPRVHLSRQEAIDKHLQGFIDQILTIEHTTMAWVFPQVARDRRPPAEEGLSSDYIFPGVVVLLSPANVYKSEVS